MNVTIYPKKLNGSIDVIASKSCLHRAIIAASLSNGTSVISNVLFSKDVTATINACVNLGANIVIKQDSLVINGVTNINDNQIVDCIESGSTLRFMIPIFLINKTKTIFIGNESLFKRPLDIYFDIFNKQNISYNFNEKLEVNGILKSGEFIIDGSVSSQFVTGLLFSLPLLKGDSKLIINNLESRGYVDITIDILKKFNIEIINNDYNEFIIKGNQTYKCFDYTAEADYSQASFFIVANELGNDIVINNLNVLSLQPDKKIIDDIANIKKSNNIDLSSNPDCGPILSILASLYNVAFDNAKRLRIKESDRISSMVINLNKLGANLIEKDDGIIFNKTDKLNGDVSIDCFNDHRVCMAIAIASTICDSKITLLGAECVSKSYPNFWDDFKLLGGMYDVE